MSTGARRRSLAEQRQILEVARAHGTPAASRWFGVSAESVNRLRRLHDGYEPRRGHPSLEDVQMARPRANCGCVMCEAEYVEPNPTYADAMLAAVAIEASFKAADREPWRLRAACVGVPTREFFPSTSHGVVKAKDVCAACPVQAECLESQMGRPAYAQYGVWGGTSERARRRAIMERQRYDQPMPATPTCPDDESIGVPAPGDPSAPPAEYVGQPTFASGAKDARSLEEAHTIMRATHGPWDDNRDEETA